MNMSKIVFILGAGAPLMKDFLDRARDLVADKNIKGREEDFAKVFNAISSLQKVHSKSELDLINIESIFDSFIWKNLMQSEVDIFNDSLLRSLAMTTS